MIQKIFNNVVIEKFSQDSGNHSNGNGSSTTRQLKFNGFFVNHRLNHFKQLTTAIKIIQKISNSEINDINDYIGKVLGNYDDDNGSSNKKNLR